MCSTPDVPDPTTYQSSEAPVYRDEGAKKSTGRRGTILTGRGGGVQDTTVLGKKQKLGI